MTVISTPLAIFNKPGPMADLLAKRGWDFRWIARDKSAPASPAAETPAHIMAAAPAMEYCICGTAPLTAAFFAAAENLRLVAMFGVGLDHIDLRAATERGVLVTNAPGTNTRCVAELALALMLDLAHRVIAMHMDLASGIWRPRVACELGGKTLGIVGLGHIGRETARLGKAFGMNVVAANRTPRPEIAAHLGIEQCTLEDVLRQADFLSLHIPGGPESWRIGRDELALMKKTAFVINTARGDVLDIEALADALEAGDLTGAGLDVFPQEPMPSDHRIFRLPNVVCAPHAGAMSMESMVAVTDSCLAEVERILRKERSPNARNPEIYSGPGWKDFA